MADPAEQQPDEEVRPDDGGDGGSPPRRLFATWLQEQRNGGLHHELTEGLAEVTTAVQDLQKAGSLTLTLKIVPAGKEQQAVIIADDVKVKAPAARGSSMFFTDPHGNLYRRDPRQPELPLRDVSRPQKPTRQIGD